MNTSIPIPSIGTRFLFHGSQFEISFIGHGICRYSAIAGGRIRGGSGNLNNTYK